MFSVQPVGQFRRQIRQQPSAVRFGAFLCHEYDILAESEQKFQKFIGLTALRHRWFRKAFEKGTHALDKGQPAKAIRFLNKAMYYSWPIEKIRWQAILQLGRAYRMNGQREEAYGHYYGGYNLALLFMEKDKPLCVQSRIGFGNISIERFMEYLQRTEIDGEKAKPWRLYEAYRSLGDAQMAFSHARSLFTENPDLHKTVDDSPVWEGHGVVHFLQGRYPQAEDCFRQGLQSARAFGQPANKQISLLIKLGRALLAQGDKAKYAAWIDTVNSTTEPSQNVGKAHQTNFATLLRLKLTALIATEGYEEATRTTAQLLHLDKSFAGKGDELTLRNTDNILITQDLD